MIIAVVVAYHPQLTLLAHLLDALKQQVDHVLIVDNGSTLSVGDFISEMDAPHLHYLALGENKGVATAHNIGTKWARDRQAEFVLLLDQDSLPALDMVRQLKAAHCELVSRGIKVAAVGPRYLDERNPEHSLFSRSQGMRLIREKCLHTASVIPTDFLISSGSLIHVDALNQIGDMNEAFFIDQVDLEWCLRARTKGYSTYGVCMAVMAHSLGTRPLNLLGKKLVHHNPLRHYYIFRNAVWLIKRKHIPLAWRLRLVRVLLARLIFYPIFVGPRFHYLKMMILGIHHGLFNRMGMLD